MFESDYYTINRKKKYYGGGDSDMDNSSNDDIDNVSNNNESSIDQYKNLLSEISEIEKIITIDLLSEFTLDELKELNYIRIKLFEFINEQVSNKFLDVDNNITELQEQLQLQLQEQLPEQLQLQEQLPEQEQLQEQLPEQE